MSFKERVKDSNIVKEFSKLRRKPYIYDLKTKNLSFIQTATDLKTLGIKNCMFFLKLYNPNLQGVDPHSKLLSNETIIDIINECIINPYYFLRECVRIPEQGGPGTPFLLNRGNLALAWCFFNGIDAYLVLPRQIGKTQSTISLIDWAFLLGTTNSEIMFVNKKEDDAKNNLNRLKEQRDALPEYLRFNVAVDEDGKLKKSTDNVKTLENLNNKNKISVKASARSKEAAVGLGRGCTQPIQYFDEVEFTPFIGTIIKSSGPAFRTARENAMRNKAIYGRIFTSTPGDLDTLPGKESQEIISKTCRFTEQFYDKKISDVKDYIIKNSKNRIVYIEFDYKQLGKDEKWFDDICVVCQNDPMEIKREVLLQRMRGSSSSPFDAADLDSLNDIRLKPIQEEFILPLFKLDIYKKLDRTKIYLVGVDVSNGYGQDNSAVVITDPDTFDIVAEFQSPYIGVTDLKKFLYVLVKKYLPRAILCIERNMNGEAVIDHLMQTPIAHNVYFDHNRVLGDGNSDDKLTDEGYLKREAAKRRLRGVWTGTKSREKMMTILETHMREYRKSIVGSNVINDIQGLEINNRGKILAAEGNHDDSIMAYLMTLYVYYFGANLAKFGYVKPIFGEDEKPNQGLDETTRILNELSEYERELFEPTITKSVNDYDMDIVKEIERARQMTQLSDDFLVNTRIEDYTDETIGSYDLGDDFFTELNM